MKPIPPPLGFTVPAASPLLLPGDAADPYGKTLSSSLGLAVQVAPLLLPEGAAEPIR